MAGIPGTGDAAGLARGDNELHGDWTDAADRHGIAALTAVGVVLAAGRGRSGHRPGVAARPHLAARLTPPPGGPVRRAAVPARPGATVPLIFLRPAAAAVAITAASAVSLTVFGPAPDRRRDAAQVLAGYRLGRAGVRRPALARGGTAHRSLASRPGRALPRARARRPRRRSGRPAGRARPGRGRPGSPSGHAGEATRQAAARELIAGTLADHMARGERARIARELHDVVAHHISMIAVQAETARVTTPGLPAAGRAAARRDRRHRPGRAHRDAAAARRAPRGRRPAPPRPAPAARPAAARRADRRARETSGAGVRLIVSGQVAAFDPSVELAAYRIVQEALTNARRHAPGAAVDVELRYGERRAAAADPGQRPRPAGPAPDDGTACGAGSPGTG